MAKRLGAQGPLAAESGPRFVEAGQDRLCQPAFWNTHGAPLNSRPRCLRISPSLLAVKIAEVHSSPACCERDGLLWDVAAVYRPGAVWTKTLPFASVFDGPVVNAERQVESASLR
jgi:hypothetical protein